MMSRLSTPSSRQRSVFASSFSTKQSAVLRHGTPSRRLAEQLRELVEVALFSPEEPGLPFSNWSVPKLAELA